MRILPPTEENVHAAGRLLREGVPIGMPTETVYGIAALATDPEAVARVFQIKRRPADNPLIVHIADLEQLEEVAAIVTPDARKLAERFWPGPLTVVLPRHRRIPDIVTGGRDSVAIRMPNHPVARALIRAADSPLSAPSANLFMSLSPTRADHISEEIGRHLGLVLDGGPCAVGVESTVVDCTGASVRILRPGGVSRASVAAAVGAPLASPPNGTRLSPGMYPRHYSPDTPLKLVDVLAPDQPGITFEEPANSQQIRLPLEPQAYAAALYAALHHLDGANHSAIYVEYPPETPEWEAVWDRLRKAAFED